jgi:hypothetical protein
MNANVSEQEIATAVPIISPHRKWSDRTIAAVIEAYNAGLTFSQIGQQFDINKNQAAGILNRAGALKKRVLGRARTGIKPQNKNTNKINPRKQFRKVPFDARISAAPFLGVSLMERKFDQCAMPDMKCDDPSAMTYCGQPTYGTLPYCGYCAQIIYQPARAVHREPRPR